MDPKRYVDVRGAAAYTGYSKSTLDKMRCRGDGPTYSKPGRRKVVYALDDLEAWIAKARRQSTVEEPPAKDDGEAS